MESNPASHDYSWGPSRLSFERPHTPFPEAAIENPEEKPEEEILTIPQLGD